MVDKIRIHIKAAGINRVDLLQYLGKYPAPKSGVQGLEVAGVTDEGKRVCALLPEGGFGEDVLADATLTFEIPEHLDFAEAACLPEALFTGAEAFINRLDVQPAEAVLVGGALSGIGIIACQMARALGAEVTGLVGSEMRAMQLEDLLGIPAMVRGQPWAGSFDAALDIGAGSVLPQILTHMKEDGRVVCIGLMDGATTTLNMSEMVKKRLNLSGFMVRYLPEEHKAYLAELIKQYGFLGKVKPVIAKTYGFDQLPEALDTLKAGGLVGKLVFVRQ